MYCMQVYLYFRGAVYKLMYWYNPSKFQWHQHPGTETRMMRVFLFILWLCTRPSQASTKGRGSDTWQTGDQTNTMPCSQYSKITLTRETHIKSSIRNHILADKLWRSNFPFVMHSLLNSWPIQVTQSDLCFEFKCITWDTALDSTAHQLNACAWELKNLVDLVCPQIWARNRHRNSSTFHH